MLIDCNAYGNEPLEYDTVSEALADNRVVKVTRLGLETFGVYEMCDEYFCAKLTAEQLRAWGKELIDMADKTGEG
jgi:hypothetical protein